MRFSGENWWSGSGHCVGDDRVSAIISPYKVSMNNSLNIRAERRAGLLERKYDILDGAMIDGSRLVPSCSAAGWKDRGPERSRRWLV